MRKDVQEIFRSTPHEKQVMMFSATLSKDIRPVCKKFMQDVNNYYYSSSSFGDKKDPLKEEQLVVLGLLGQSFDAQFGGSVKKEGGAEEPKSKREDFLGGRWGLSLASG